MRPLPGCLSGIVIWEQPQKKFTNSININFFYRRTKTFRDIESLPTYMLLGSFPGGSAVKNSPALQKMQGTWLWSLGQEDPLEKETATYSSILAMKIPWTEKPGLQSIGLQYVTWIPCVCVCVCVRVCVRVCALSRLLVSLAPPAFASRLFTTAPPGKPRWHKYFYLIREKAH